jgi:hypothetical protein
MICPLCSSQKFDSTCEFDVCDECDQLCSNSNCSFIIGGDKHPSVFSLDFGITWHSWEETKRLAKLKSFE